jgi:hypothetical protein
MATRTQTANRKAEDANRVEEVDSLEDANRREGSFDADDVGATLVHETHENPAELRQSVQEVRDAEQAERAEETADDKGAVVEGTDVEAVADGDSPAHPTIPAEARAPVAPEPSENTPPSRKFLPNAQRDAERFLDSAGIRTDVVGDEFVDPRDVNRLGTGRGKRDAKDLALFLRLNPVAVNMLDRLDEYERDVLGIAEPDEWERPPEDMLEEAKRYNMLFPNPRNNAHITDPLSHVERS